MSKKSETRNRGGEKAALRQHVPGAVTEHGPQPRRFTPLKIGIGLGIVALGAIALFGSSWRGRDSAAVPGDKGALSGVTTTTTQPTSAPAKSAVASLPPPRPGTGLPTKDVDLGVSGPGTPLAASLPPPPPGTPVPVNDVDPVTGKPLTPDSPTLDYKGYAIGFCCDKSAGYRGEWNRMSESQKDAFVRKYLN